MQQALSFSQEVEYEYVPFPTSNAVWCVHIESGSGEKSESFEGYKLTGEDTLMTDFTYKKLFIFRTKDANDATYIGGIREDEHKRVYYRGEKIIPFKPCGFGVEYGGEFEDETLLYDFSLQVGDTVRTGTLFSLPEGHYWKVTSIDTVKVGNSYRKKININGTSEYFGWLNWIEGIGNGYGLLNCGETVIGYYNERLSCFEHNSEMIYCREDSCNCFKGLDGIEDINSKENPVKVYPNPVTGHALHFEFDKLRVEAIEIFNCTGMLTEKHRVGKQDHFHFSTEKYIAGIYFYKVITEDGIEYKGKFFIQ